MRIIRAAPPGTVELRGHGTGFPAAHDSSRAAGNGFIQVTRAIYYLAGIVNNTAANSSNVFDWLIENAGLSLPWGLPFVYNFWNVLIRTLANECAVCPGMIGGVAGWNTGLPHTQWRTDTARKRAGILVERDSLGVSRYFLSWANGIAQGNQEIAALPTGAFISLIYEPTPVKRLRVYVNGALHAGTASGDLPSGVQTDGILFSIGAGKKLISAPEASTRIYAPMLMPSRQVAA